ncbi:hypothetical protein AVEN_263119-1 [Araneus ventricosus]|uniref:Uncharacterized protein n=1 Tax=Araneus ventricosus TaxID=182803 RepID=A0A4Y2TWF2_ARAVE|nr:hypothetical protein AVEN_263119-1 [Araneus ventricosus]
MPSVGCNPAETVPDTGIHRQKAWASGRPRATMARRSILSNIARRNRGQASHLSRDLYAATEPVYQGDCFQRPRLGCFARRPALFCVLHTSTNKRVCF